MVSRVRKNEEGKRGFRNHIPGPQASNLARESCKQLWLNSP